MKNLDIEPIVEPIRGGTDGSQLSYMGLPDSKHLYRRRKLPRKI